MIPMEKITKNYRISTKIQILDFAILRCSRKHTLPHRWNNPKYMQCATRHPLTTPFEIADAIYVPENISMREITLPPGHKGSMGILQNRQQK